MRMILPIAVILAAWSSAGAEPLKPGDRLEPFAIDDQRGNPHTLDARVRAILFARDMKGGGILKGALAEAGAERLADADAVYIANVSGMPALVLRLFALPKLRRRDYPMLLDTDGRLTQPLPGADGMATLIQLRKLEIIDVTHYDSSEAVRSALDALRRDSSDSR